jgi:Flp pilus assembly protein TadD
MGVQHAVRLLAVGSTHVALAHEGCPAVRDECPQATITAHHNLAIALADSGRAADAVNEFLDAVHLQPNDAAWHYAAGVMLATTGRTEDAMRELRRSLSLDPSRLAAQRALANLAAQKPLR